MTLGERLREARIYRELTQTEVSRKSGINSKTLSNWEHDVSRPGPEDLLALSEIYETSVDSLLGKVTHNTPFGRAVLSAMDRDILADYHALPPEAKSTVDFIFSQYRQEKKSGYGVVLPFGRVDNEKNGANI